MDIVHFGKYYWPEKGGVETAVRNLAELGTELGHSVECVVSSPKERAQQLDSVGSVRVVRYPYRTKLLSTPLSFHFHHFLKHRTSHADILHVHLPNPTAELTLLWRLLRKGRSQTVLIPFIHSFPVNQKLLGKLWFHLVTQRLLSRAKFVFASNHKFVNAFPQIAKWQHKIRIMPFFVPLLSDEEFAQTALLRRKRPKRVLALGRLVPYKGYDLLLRAWQLALSLEPKLSRYELNIVGDGPEKENLRRLVRELGLERSAVVRGPCSDEEKLTYYETAHFFIAPSRNNAETFGISILEAMGFGLPVITTDLDTGVRTLSRDGLCGAVVKAGAIEPLTSAILRLANYDNTERERLGHENLQFARSRYSRESSSAAYQNFFASIEPICESSVRTR